MGWKQSRQILWNCWWRLIFKSIHAVQSATSSATSTSAVIPSNGVATFHAEDGTLAKKITAVDKGINTGAEKAGAIALFEHEADSYIFIHDGIEGLYGNDILIKLLNTDLDGKTPTLDGQYLTIL